MMRFGFEMSSYVKYNETVSIIGNYIAYLNGFFFYVFLIVRLLMIFKESIYALPKWRIITYFAVILLNLIYGWTMSTLERQTSYINEISSTEKTIIAVIYTVVQFILTSWILIAFNARLYLLILTSPDNQNEGLLTPLNPNGDSGSCLDVDNKKQQQYLQLITKQTLLMSIILIFGCINILNEMFTSLLPDLYNHNQWKVLRLIWRTSTVILIYISFKFELSNKVYGIICKPLHRSCYFCCKWIVEQKLNQKKYKVTINNEKDKFYL